MKASRPIHVWLPGLSFTGGIQAFSRDLLEALALATPDVSKTVLLKNDRSEATPARDDVKHASFGWCPAVLRTALFTAGLAFYAVLQRPALIIVGHANFAGIASFLNRFFGARFWVMVYGVEVWGENGRRVAGSLCRADRILSISGFTRDKLVCEQGLDPARFEILPTTFDGSRFGPRPRPASLLRRLNLTPENRLILTVCRIAHSERHKGYDQIIRAMPAVLDAVPEAHYVIVGTGGDETRIRRLAASLGLEKHVTLAGYVAREDLAAYYNVCDVFAMPSKKEGFGIVFLEALASGKPVLAGNLDGSVDALCGGELGALVDPDDVDEIARTLISILKGSYPLPIMYESERLSEKVTDIYGFARFAATLKRYLRDDRPCIDDSMRAAESAEGA